MEYAIDSKGNRVWIGNANKNKTYYCPICSGELTLKKEGKIKIEHFAHKSNECTDNWSYDMSEWHRGMQELFDEQYREIVCESRGKKHRADVLKDGVVVEFQHSLLSADEFMERNEFYMSLGYRVVWVFDVSDAYIDGNLYYENRDDDVIQMRWKYAKRMLKFSPDLSDFSNKFALFLWFRDDEGMGGMEKVIWSTKDELGDYDFRRIIVSGYNYELEENMDPNEFFLGKRDYLQERLNQVKPYSVKKIGLKGFPRDSYICPRKKEFGLKLYSEKGCSYCKYCGAIEKISKNRYGSQCNVYCCFPKQVNKITDPELGLYESEAPMF